MSDSKNKDYIKQLRSTPAYKHAKKVKEEILKHTTPEERLAAWYISMKWFQGYPPTDQEVKEMAKKLGIPESEE